MGTAILTLIKLIFAILLVPVCYALTTNFSKELVNLGTLEPVFVGGALTYVFLQLFFYSPQGIFQFGQKIFGDIFKSMPILAAVIPLFVPILPTIILVACFVTISFFDYLPAQVYLIFFAGFVAAMHIILSAHAEFEEDDNVLKPHYLFLMSLTYIFNVALISLLLSLNFPHFSVTTLATSTFDTAKDIYVHIYNQLFVMK